MSTFDLAVAISITRPTKKVENIINKYINGEIQETKVAVSKIKKHLNKNVLLNCKEYIKLSYEKMEKENQNSIRGHANKEKLVRLNTLKVEINKIEEKDLNKKKKLFKRK